MAEITLSHLLQLATEQGSPLSREQALAFLNQEGRAFEMWKQMMHAGEEFCRPLVQDRRKTTLFAAFFGGVPKVHARLPK